jgi:transposase
MILDLHRQGLSVSAIARKLDLDRKTVRKYIQRGVEPPVYGPRLPRPMQVDPFVPFLKDRITAYPGLSGSRLMREIQGLGYGGCYTSVKDALRELRPPRETHFEHRFETAAGDQAQVDFASFKTVFSDSPGEIVTVWLFSLVLGHSRFLWGEYVWHQDLLTVLRCHVAAFAALGGSPRQILYDRMKTAVIGEAVEGIIYNAQLQSLARHYGFVPRACAAYRAKTKGKVERPFRYIRQDFFLGRTFRNLEDLNTQFSDWRERIANRRRHGTTHQQIDAAFAAEAPALQPSPALPFNAILALDRQISHDGMVAFNSNAYSVPDGVRGRSVDLQVSLSEVQIFAEGKLVACHPLSLGRNERCIAPGHRRWPPPKSTQHRPRERTAVVLGVPGEQVARRPLHVYERIGAALAGGGRR